MVRVILPSCSVNLPAGGLEQQAALVAQYVKASCVVSVCTPISLMMWYGARGRGSAGVDRVATELHDKRSGAGRVLVAVLARLPVCGEGPAHGRPGRGARPSPGAKFFPHNSAVCNCNERQPCCSEVTSLPCHAASRLCWQLRVPYGSGLHRSLAAANFLSIALDMEYSVHQSLNAVTARCLEAPPDKHGNPELVPLPMVF